MNWYLKVLNQYSDFSGRARREEYWMFNFFNFLISISIIILGQVLGITIEGLGYYGLLYSIYYLFILIPSFAVLVRRLHDVGKSGWMSLIILIPIIGAIWLIVLLATDGELGENQYGENPKYINKDNFNTSDIIKKDEDFEESLLLIPKKTQLLEETFKSGLISQNELNEKLRILETEKTLLESKLREALETEKENELHLRIEQEIKNDKEKLIELKKQGLLTEKEYDDKIDFLFKKQLEINENERLKMEKQLEKEEASKLSTKSELLLIGGVILIILLFVAFRYYSGEL